jgi:alpha-tubulin suppressor-like RCC1 family protein
MFIRTLLILIALALGACSEKGGVAGRAYTLFAAVYSGDHFSCAKLADGQTQCWGANNSGQLGLGDTNNRGDDIYDFRGTNMFLNVGIGRTISQLSGGSEHACALMDNGKVKCWGENYYGQLGYGDTSFRGIDSSTTGENLTEVDLGTGRTAISVAAGRYHTCALLDNGTVKCWGANNYGQLGKDNTTSLGDNSNEMGDFLTAINLGAGRTALAMDVGQSFTCALLDDGTVKCWGANYYGHLGVGSTVALGDAAGEMAALAAIDLGTGRTARSIALGSDHACALLDNFDLKCWGIGFYGNLGTENFQNLGDGAGEMGDALTAINLGTGRYAVSVQARAYRTCAILDNNALKCWGQNDYGALGRGNTANAGQFAGEMGDNLLPVDVGTGRFVRGVAMGYNHTCVIMDNAFVKCWGRNLYGQLGVGHTVNRGDNSGEMGDSLTAVNGWNMQH